MTDQPGSKKDPHFGQPVRYAGEPLTDARAAVLMAHGRGAQAEDILSLVPLLKMPGVAFVAPQASGNAWYPNRFMEPVQSNEPWLSSALALIDRTLTSIREAGVPAERTILLGFSQGACLILEYAARNARRYGGLAGLSGGLIGQKITAQNYPGSLDGTPVFLGCSDVDFHIPKERVDETAEVLRRMGGQVTERLYPNMDHTVNEDEIAFVRGMLGSLVGNPGGGKGF